MEISGSSAYKVILKDRMNWNLWLGKLQDISKANGVWHAGNAPIPPATPESITAAKDEFDRSYKRYITKIHIWQVTSKPYSQIYTWVNSTVDPKLLEPVMTRLRISKSNSIQQILLSFAGYWRHHCPPISWKPNLRTEIYSSRQSRAHNCHMYFTCSNHVELLLISNNELNTLLYLLPRA